MRRVAGLGRVPLRGERRLSGADGAGDSSAPGRRTIVNGAHASSTVRRAEQHVPVALRVAAGWSWRLIVIGTAVYILSMMVGRVRTVVIPVIAGLLIAALIHPLAQRFQRMGLPRLGAAFAALIVFFLIVTGAGVAVGFNAANEIPAVADQVSKGIDQIRDYLTDGPFHLSEGQIDDLVDDIRKSITDNRGKVVSGVLSTASVAAEVLTSILVALFSTFFFLYDGERIWNWIVTRFPAGAEDRVRGAGREAWNTITGYIRGTVFVAAVDAIGITIGLLAVGAPLVAPLALLTFFGGFIPIVGATVAGIAAVLVVLVSNGLGDALIILGVVIAVQQLEGHLLQPLIMRRAVRLHPLAIVIALSAGTVLAGIPGAIAAVPFVAVVNRIATYLASEGKDPTPADG
ncbi:AI-2E family transporter [Frankia sp. CcI49]|uniref:AI-2E family transporter n=1 Tax=unclassified Frankia TaxID=2632575 RepID=UPI0006C9FFC3|nr:MULTISPECIES: AI-2E family transporter [unclassified Frankia]KPM54801.1 permease [Frankia sp. R43]ONH60991.1 AI-2E family transporter [Frankia sp. CcI49]